MPDIFERSQPDNAKTPYKKWVKPEVVDIDGEVEAGLGGGAPDMAEFPTS